LRQIARRSGVRGVWHNKPEVIAGLAPALADPGGVQSALAGLGAAEWPALFAVYFAAGERGVPEEEIGASYRALGGGNTSVPVEPSPNRWQVSKEDYRLIPDPPAMPDDALRWLADQTGHTPDAVAFAFALLQALGAVEGRDPFVLREDRLQTVLARPPAERQ